ALYRRIGGDEASKIEAEHLLHDFTRTRSIALGRLHPRAGGRDARTGGTTQMFGFAPLVDKIWRGKLPAIPGGPQHWLPLVAVDFLARCLHRAPHTPVTR